MLIDISGKADTSGNLHTEAGAGAGASVEAGAEVGGIRR